MPHAFNARDFEHVLADCQRLPVGAADHEHQFPSLVDVLDAGSDITAALDADLGVAVESHGVNEPSASGDGQPLFATVRRLCRTAREQRQLTEVIMARLVGDLARTHTSTHGVDRVLVVDDSSDNREMAAAVLEANGFDVITASDGLEGVLAAHYARPVVVIMDLSMPILDGIQEHGC